MHQNTHLVTDNVLTFILLNVLFFFPIYISGNLLCSEELGFFYCMCSACSVYNNTLDDAQYAV